MCSRSKRIALIAASGLIAAGGVLGQAGTAHAASCAENKTYAQTLRANFGAADTNNGSNSADGYASSADLLSLSENASAPSALRDAARYFMNNRTEWEQLDGARSGGRLDGLITPRDLEAFDLNQQCG